MQITLSTFTMSLEDEPLDVGYASERVIVADGENKEVEIGGQNGNTQLIFTTPFLDDALVQEYTQIVRSLPKNEEHEVVTNLIVANDTHHDPEIDGVNFLIDKRGEFRDFYGVGLVGEPCDGELTKAVILISKDGAIFYDEFAKDLHNQLNVAMLLHKVAAAQTCYTGKGCH